MEYEPSIWGPSYWFFLDNVAFTYPTYPNDVIKKKYYDLFQNLPFFIPHYKISNRFQELLDLYPIKSYLDNKKSLIKWVNFIHNKINVRLDKPTITLSEHYAQFHTAYEPNQSKLHRFFKERYKVIIVIFILLLALFAYTQVIQHKLNFKPIDVAKFNWNMGS